MGIVLFHLKKWRNKYRRQLIIVFICIAIPFAAEGIYYLTIVTGINNYNIYFTPHSIALMSVCLYIGVMRFDIFDIIPAATITAMDHIKEGFILTDAEGNYLSCNSAALGIFPGIAKLAKGGSVFSVEEWPEELKNLGGEKADFSITRENTRYYQTSISSVFSQDNLLKAKIILIRDVTEAAVLMKELENAAYTDALTGLYNRRYFSELASMTMERSRRLKKPIYAVMIDLDLFKQVNDAYGHAAGDLVLKTTAGIIRQTVRAYDVVGRYGGEEFVLILTDTDLNGAGQLLERIRKNVASSEVKYQEAGIRITCSIGFAKFEADDSLEKAINKADSALYTAKNGGRNMVRLFGPVC
jgi:diguanylate cyclase (GGDEF)-like protein